MMPEPIPPQRRRGKEHVAATATQDCHVWSVAPGDPHFPANLANAAPPIGEGLLYGIGNRDLLTRKCVGLICSVKCPGSIVIKTFDAIRELRDAGIVVAGGFHSPMEQECLEFLLRGRQPVIVAPARGLLGMRLPATWRSAVDSGRLLIVSPFGDSVRRTTKVSARARNEFIISHANAVLIPHASPGGQAEAIARSVIETGRPLFTFAGDENQNLRQLGVRSFDVGAFMNYRGEREHQ